MALGGVGLLLLVVQMGTMERSDLSTNMWEAQAILLLAILMISLALWMCITRFGEE